MKFYRAAPLNTIPAGHGKAGPDAAADLPGGAPVIAIRLADLVSPAAGSRPRVTGRHWWWPAPPRSVPGISWCS